MAKLAAAHGVDLLDAPVSGGSPAANAGTLAVMANAGRLLKFQEPYVPVGAV